MMTRVTAVVLLACVLQVNGIRYPRIVPARGPRIARSCKVASPEDGNSRVRVLAQRTRLKHVRCCEADSPDDAKAPRRSFVLPRIAALSLSCYLNLSRCYFKSAEFLTARQACDAALAIDGDSDKALLLRARARVGPKSHGATELEQALKAVPGVAAAA